MNRQIKILSIFLVITTVVTVVLFFVVLNEHNYDIFVTLMHFCFMFSFPLLFFLLLIREWRLLKLPLKNKKARILAIQRQYDNLKNHYFYTVSFEIDSNTTWTFRVSVEIINVISVGQQGVLTYREKKSKLYFVF